jgi:hypothetical protein
VKINLKIKHWKLEKNNLDTKHVRWKLGKSLGVVLLVKIYVQGFGHCLLLNAHSLANW